MLWSNSNFVRGSVVCLLLAGLSADAGVQRVVLLKQPPLDAISGILVIHHKSPEGKFGLISWQKNPNTSDGSFVPVDWNVGEKTGLVIPDNRSRFQAGMANRPGSTAAQVFRTAVGAYLNSDDLSSGGGTKRATRCPAQAGTR